MSYPVTDRPQDQVESRYTLVILAAKRAKQLREGAPRLIETSSTNPLTVALEEIAAGKVTFDVPSHDEISASGIDSTMEAIPEVEAPQEEAAELIAETPVDEAARVAELLKLPDEEEETEEESEDLLAAAELLAADDAEGDETAEEPTEPDAEPESVEK